MKTGRQSKCGPTGIRQLTYIVSDIYHVDVERDLGGKFDLIVLKDVIEHNL